ncbi:hypothetical protein QJS10_CPB12g01093 [Acorus calamus]|uniref:Zinc finger CCCH domain-containing protein 13-like n=1 Tax=Acorus calamus TaxID=4465 RepID=A0AAV9DP49_ACOCL|nr:hypothetical protein QJS10_CPB12g01093 [Acorus calamus]
MPRSSRHKSHRQHKHKDRSDSEEDVGGSRDRKAAREEPPVGVAAAGVVRVSQERKSSSVKDPVALGNSGDHSSGDRGKKRKDRTDSVVVERWNGGEDGVEKESLKKETLGLDLEKGVKQKASGVESKSRSGRRDEGEENEEVKKSGKDGGSRSDSKRKSERELGRREESRQQYGPEREKKVQDGRQERTGYGAVGEGSKRRGGSEEEHPSKREVDNTEWKIQDDLRNPELEKELEKRIRRRDGSGDKDKWQDDSRDGDDKRTSSRDDHAKNGKCKDDRHKDEKYHDKCHEDVDKDQKQREDHDRDHRHRDDHDRDNKDREEHDRDRRRRDDHDRDRRHREDHDRDRRHREEEHRRRDDLDRDHRRRDDLDRDHRRREDLDRDHRRQEELDRDQRHRVERDRDQRRREDLERDQRRRDDLDRDQRQRDDKSRDDRSSRDYIRNRSDNKLQYDESKSSENRHKKAKLQDDHDDMPCIDGRDTRYRESRGRKRSFDEKEDHFDLKAPSAKEQCIDVENAEVSSKLIYNTERDRSEISEVGDYKRNDQLKSSPATSVNTAKDQDRHHSKQAESGCRDSLPEERRRQSATVTASTLGGSGSWQLEKSKPKNDYPSGELLMENTASPRRGRTTSRSDGRTSPIRLTEKSPSSTSEQRYSNRSVVRRSLNVEETRQRSIGSKDNDRELPLERPSLDEFSQSDLPNESIPVSSTSLSRPCYFPNGSPSHLLPPTPMRHGIDNLSVLGSFDEDTRSQAGDSKSNNRYKRSGDLNMGRGQTWKGIPNWPTPNGFLPYPHGPPPGGYHPAVHHFAATPLFGVRPSMDMNHYHMHEADRFTGHGHPFDHMHGWDGRNNIFGEETHVFGRPDWDQNRHMINNRGWEMSTEMWKTQNGNINMEFPTQKEMNYPATTSVDERQRNEQGQSIEIMHSDAPAAKSVPETPPALVPEKKPKTPDPSESLTDNGPPFWTAYLSMLDISRDLACPDLYKQCLSLLDKGDLAGDSNVSNHFSSEEEKIRAKSFSSNLISYFSLSNMDDVFQKALTLYKRQKDETKGGIPTARQSKEPTSSTISEKVDNTDAHISPEHTSQADITPTNFEGGAGSSGEKCSPPGDAEEEQFEDRDGVVHPEISKTCEASMPDSVECRLNSSRIHLSPESTH